MNQNVRYVIALSFMGAAVYSALLVIFFAAVRVVWFATPALN